MTLTSVINQEIVKKLTNVALRVLSLGAKLVLTVYMGRYLGLADLGIYGLVFAGVTLASGAIGLRLDYVVARALVGADSVESLRLMRDQAVFMGLNYVLFGFILLIGFALGLADARMLAAIFVIGVFDSLSGAMTGNLIALGRPLASTALFFLRAGLWCLVAVVCGLVWPAWRNVDVILSCWAVGEMLAVAWNLWLWRHMPWREVAAIPVRWAELAQGVRRCFPIWLGTLGAMLALSIDRFVVSYYLDLEQVGIITFYSSFAIALLSLVQSGFFAFTYPKLIAYHRLHDAYSFWREAYRTGWQVALFVFLCAVAIGILLPLSAPLFNKPELVAESLTLWLLLAGIWVRANADTFYYVLYAQEQDRPLWLGAILFLIPATLGNVILIPMVGLAGAGYSSILACLFLLGWRVYYVRKAARTFFENN